MSKKIRGHNKHTSKKYYKSKDNDTDRTSIWLLSPIIFIIAVLPFIMKLKYYQANLSKYSWFTYEDVYSDFFLYYKQGFFLITIFIMAAILLYKGYTDKRNIDFPRILVPLAVYGGLALLSSIFSKYRSYSFSGIHEHFESIFVLLGYCLIVYYCLQVVKTEEDVGLIINCFLVSVIVMSILGLTQYLGRDFFTTDIGLKMILPKAQWPIRDSVQFKFEKNRVYLTFYNPNYVGSYAAMAGSFFLVLASLVRERKRMIPLYILASLGIFISLLGSKSKTGIIALAISGVFVLIVISKYIIKYFYFSIPIVLLLISIVVLYNKANDNILSNQIKQATTFHKTEVSLKDIITDDDKVIVNYQENQLHVQYSVEDGYGYFSAEDDNGKTLDLEFSEDTNEFIVQDERFPGFKLGIDLYNDTPIFYITIDNHDWFFTNQTDGTYYYLNPYGKLDKIKTAPHAVFSGYEKYASGRGYIWSRTIPLLKKNILLGSGADSYMLEFPQQDYVALHNFGFGNQLLTKPHNLYLQISVQTGLLSLIAFLAFYGMYFISSLKLYLKGKYKSYYAKVGVATLVASLNYMILGLANDSSITVTPVFWVLLGLGITVNRLAKPHIDEELSEDK